MGRARRFQRLSAAKRSIVFYAEGAADWAHFSPVIEELVGPLGRTICYLTSDPNDPVLSRGDDRMLTFYIGSGTSRTLQFRLLSANVMVMTLPDRSTASRADRHVLVAPSWGPCSLLENPCGMALLRTLLNAGYRVTLRMHPMTVRQNPELAITIASELVVPDRFTIETDMTSHESLQTSHVMVSDWSGGAALDYAFGLERPVLFVNTPMKINNPEYEKIDMTPLEVSVRTEVGDVVDPEQIDDVPQKIESPLRGSRGVSAAHSRRARAMDL